MWAWSPVAPQNSQTIILSWGQTTLPSCLSLWPRNTASDSPFFLQNPQTPLSSGLLDLELLLPLLGLRDIW